MKKSIIFGVLAMFAVSALSIQSVEAQNPVKNTTTTEKVTVKPQDKKTVTVDKKTNESCADTKVAKDQKNVKSDCCEQSKVKSETKSCCSEKKVVKDEKNVKVDCKKECKKESKTATVKPKDEKEIK